MILSIVSTAERVSIDNGLWWASSGVDVIRRLMRNNYSTVHVMMTETWDCVIKLDLGNRIADYDDFESFFFYEIVVEFLEYSIDNW